MGLRDLLRGLTSGGNDSASIFYGGQDGVAMIHGLSVETLWRTQPHLRTVVDFLARNSAHVGFKMYQRAADDDRRRIRAADDPFAMILEKPNDRLTGYDLIYALVSDLCLYNEAFWVPSTSAIDGRLTIEVISPSWCVGRGGGSLFGPDWFEFLVPSTHEKVKIKASDLFYFPSYNPGNNRAVSSPVESLKQLLFEQLEAQQYRRQVWRKGGRFGGFLTRPAGARWQPDVRDRFRLDWNAKFGPDGSEAGGTPILEDGMEYKTAQVSAREQEWLEGTKLSLATVAGVYQVNPTMVGLLDNANFANVREFRRALYGDTLGPIFESIAARLNSFVMPVFTQRPRSYVEANINEKLQGSFEEQVKALQSAVGRPYMTADEARALMNMRAMGGEAAELVVPLNVLIGGQASPRDSAPDPADQGQASAPIVLREVKPPLKMLGSARGVTFKAADPGDSIRILAEKTLSSFFERQSAVVIARMGAKAPNWWDEERWNRELSDDLFKVGMAAVSQTGPTAAAELGFKASDFDVPRTEAYVRSMAEFRASMVNQTTLEELQSVDAEKTPAHVFEVAQSSRSISGAGALTAAFLSFATVEVAHQLIGDDRASKTWTVHSANPRASHARMNGQTVPLKLPFSNGANWPGDPAAGVAEVAGCHCGVEVSY